jgi:hypothetical protein
MISFDIEPDVADQLDWIRTFVRTLNGHVPEIGPGPPSAKQADSTVTKPASDVPGGRFHRRIVLVGHTRANAATSVLQRTVPTVGQPSPRTSPSPLWVWDERHPHDRQDASNVTLSSVGMGRTSPSRPTPLLPTSPRTSPSQPPRTIGCQRTPQKRQSPVLCPSPQI